MSKQLRALLFIFCIGYSLPLFAQGVKFSKEEKTIIELQDKRTDIDEIAKYLSSPNEKVAWRAAVALGNIGDSTARPILIKRLAAEKRELISDAITFALGILGANTKSFKAVATATELFPNQEHFIALARTTPANEITTCTEYLTRYSTTHPKPVAYALTELGLRKLLNDDLIALVKQLDAHPDASVRWHAIYGLSRTTDSALLSRHLDVLKEFLSDQGSAESRMFAATALGQIHNLEAGRMLIAAIKSELEWRVRVNIFNAITKLPYFSSTIFESVKKAVLESTIEDVRTIHPALAALTMLDNMLANGKVSTADSVTVRDWLAGFNPQGNQYDGYPIAVRASTMIPVARFGKDALSPNDIAEYFSNRDRAVDIYTCRALGNFRDTTAMITLLRRYFQSVSTQTLYALEGLHGQWKLIQNDSVYRNTLEKFHFASAYRHILIRTPDQTDLVQVVGLTLELLQEPGVAVDSFKTEAEEYLLRYLEKYNTAAYSDQMISVLSAIQTLKPSQPEFRQKIKAIYHKAATDYGNAPLANEAYKTLDSLGGNDQKKLAVIYKHEPIDWKMLETAPDTLLVPTKYGFYYLKLMPYDAPLSVLNILKLAKVNFFANCYVHRVVPNFVIQTGDNTGSGYGGPGYSIRTEISPAQYDTEGIVGMASSGKDTEGSQWFITHCPTPHLNTRYTIWAKALKSNEQIDRTQLDDQIENVILYK